MAINVLNIQPNQPKALLEDYIFLVYGRAKSGKTSLFYELTKQKFDGDLSKSLLIAFERGYKALNGIHAVDVGDWKVFSDLVDELVENYDDIPYRWLGLDTLDVMYQMATEYIVRTERINRKDPKLKAINDIPYGGGYQLVDEEIQRVLGKLIKQNFGLFMITHDTDKKFESRNGQSYDKTTVSLPKRARNTFVNMSDFIVFIDISKEKDGKKLVDNRYIHFRSDSDIEAGSRFKNVPDFIEYDPARFLEVFSDAVLESYDDDEKAVEEAQEEQEQERQEEAKENSEKEQKKASNDDMKDEIAEAIKGMSKDEQAEFKKKLKAELGSINYKKFDKAKLEKAVELIKA